MTSPWRTRRRQRWIAKLRRLAIRTSEENAVVHTGGADSRLNRRVGPDWLLPGTQRLALTPVNNEKRCLAGAHDPWNHRLVCVEGDRKASWLFLNLLRALLEACDRTEKIRVTLDNYIIHKSRVRRAWLAEFGDADLPSDRLRLLTGSRVGSALCSFSLSSLASVDQARICSQ